MKPYCRVQYFDAFGNPGVEYISNFIQFGIVVLMLLSPQFILFELLHFDCDIFQYSKPSFPVLHYLVRFILRIMFRRDLNLFELIRVLSLL